MGLTANTGPYNAAAEYYGVDDTLMSKIPRKKFNFTVEITINEDANYSDPVGGKKFTFHRVQGVNLPDYSFNTVNVNQYNKIRYLHTRVEPTPAGITFYDTVDNQFQNLLSAYATHYSSQGLNLPRSAMVYDTVSPAMSNPFGIQPTSTSGRYFFPEISITSQDTSSSGRSISMLNCVISSVQHDRLDYSDSAPVLWQVQFQPEHVNVLSGNGSNGSSASGVNAPTIAYDVAKSNAAGVLVDSLGQVIRNAAGGPIDLSSVTNFGATATSNQLTYALNSLGDTIKDSSGNPLVLAEVAANVVNPKIGQTINNVKTAVSNVSRVTDTVNTFKNNGFAAGFNRVFNGLF